MTSCSISIVVLTYNRPDELIKTIETLRSSVSDVVEILVVDNASEIPASQVLNKFSAIKCIRMERNIGVGARNIGVERAKGEIVVTLDDDVRGISQQELDYVAARFYDNYSLAAINFKVLEDGSEKQINWCHHRKLDEWANKRFETYEISEGAVALRKAKFLAVGMYPENFFISHEGPDLAIRFINEGGVVEYNPLVSVIHARSPVARVSWRRYYFDTRNLIWFVYKYFGVYRGSKKLFIGLGSLFVYAVRDGFLRYWFKAVFDAVKGRKANFKQKISSETWHAVDRISKANPSFFYMVRKRIVNKNVEI